MPGAWTAPSTWTNGTVVTDVMLNAQIRDNMLWLGGTAGAITQSVFASSATTETTTSNSGVTMTAPSAAITTVGGDVLLYGGGSFANSSAGAINSLYIFIDGALNGPMALWTQAGSNAFASITVVWKPSTPSSAPHTYALGWATTAGTLTTTTQANRWMLALEVRR